MTTVLTVSGTHILAPVDLSYAYGTFSVYVRTGSVNDVFRCRVHFQAARWRLRSGDQTRGEQQ